MQQKIAGKTHDKCRQNPNFNHIISNHPNVSFQFDERPSDNMHMVNVLVKNESAIWLSQTSLRSSRNIEGAGKAYSHLKDYMTHFKPHFPSI